MSDLPTRIREHAKRVVGVLVEQDLNRAANEIERLREELAERDNRIEGFENRTLMEKVDDICEGISDTHIITTDQIRAAWRDAIFATRPDEEQTEFLEARQLGIVRCECADHGLTHGESGPCVLCNGEGWVMKDETHPLLKSQGLPSPVGAGALEEDDV